MSTVQEQLQYNGKVQEICQGYFTPAKTLPDGSPNPSDNPAMRAEAASAITCMTVLANIFKGIETGSAVYTIPAIIATSFGLSENQFWKQYSATFVPVFKSALHATLVANIMKLNGVPINDPVYIAQRTQWHSLFILAYDCIYGMAKAMEVSIVLLQDVSKAL